MNWTKVKPDVKKVNKEFILLTASWAGIGQWYVTSYEILGVDSEEGFYWGVFNDDEEWGDYADLEANLYKIVDYPTVESIIHE